ncbi:hypothetical protein [Brevundimonas denitrificans]|uniref:hypothetical protein n=1 Tax=Brevundimonas denitrificans TaxID=1443434 RepID=UPI00223AFFC3|nr:hypothetical protein [Brevundimonas denitrificans]
MARHGDTAYRLHAAIRASGCALAYSALLHWRRGSRAPQGAASLKALGAIEHRYRLAPGYFLACLARARPQRTRGRRARAPAAPSAGLASAP